MYSSHWISYWRRKLCVHILFHRSPNCKENMINKLFFKCIHFPGKRCTLWVHTKCIMATDILAAFIAVKNLHSKLRPTKIKLKKKWHLIFVSTNGLKLFGHEVLDELQEQFPVSSKYLDMFYGVCTCFMVKVWKHWKIGGGTFWHNSPQHTCIFPIWMICTAHFKELLAIIASNSQIY